MALIIRNARIEDAGIVAGCVLSAFGYDVYSKEGKNETLELGDTAIKVSDALDIFAQICAREETLYSYTRAKVAELDGLAAGVLVSYPGEENARLREKTWGLAMAAAGGSDSPASSEFIKNAPAECKADEYYLDSLAVLPEFRGMSFEYAGSSGRLGHLLLTDGILAGRAKGFTRTSLIVDVSKSKLERYYASLGFRTESELLFFGHPYHRMVLYSNR